MIHCAGILWRVAQESDFNWHVCGPRCAIRRDPVRRVNVRGGWGGRFARIIYLDDERVAAVVEEMGIIGWINRSENVFGATFKNRSM